MKSLYSARHDRITTPIMSTSTPTPMARRLPSRASSPTESSVARTATVTPFGFQKVNIVNRMAIEGKARQDDDGAGIKMYLKISVPMDSVTPGTTIPMFPEENIKVLSTHLHPLDKHSAPYHFNTAAYPQLSKAARALNLPARANDTFYTAFNLAQSTISSSSGRVVDVVGIDESYTGQIVVSNYQVCYVTPRISPMYDATLSRAPLGGRRTSIGGEKQVMQFLVVIDMWIPYTCKPPRAPYLLSIPTPRCLNNSIRLKIPPPKTPAGSFSSLSSDEEGAWDLASEPHVTRSTTTRPTRSSYNDFADDESSDSSTAGFSDGCGIQGTFPAGEHIRVRWALPAKNIGISGEGRRRVGVTESQGKMTCRIRGKASHPTKKVEGVLMDVEYEGSCQGVWYGGVATMLGMDVALEAKGSDVSWAEGYPESWEASGGKAFTGFDDGRTRLTDSRHDSLDASPLSKPVTSRTNSLSSTSSTSSLLRAPLPNQPVAEYSFEGSGTSSAASSQLIGSIASSVVSTNQSGGVRPPSDPITLHVNMNELLTPDHPPFTFKITGTILLTPKNPSRSGGRKLQGDSDEEKEVDPINLPRLTVMAANKESTSILVRNDIETSDTNVEVYNSTGDIRRDAQARKTVLQKGNSTRFGDDGGRIALREVTTPNGGLNGLAYIRALQTPSRSTTPDKRATSPQMFPLATPKPRRDGPTIIPYVSTTVTPLSSHGERGVPSAYSVRVSFPAPALPALQSLEFGLGKTSLPATRAPAANQPKVDLIGLSVDGVLIKYESSQSTPHPSDAASASGVGELVSEDWLTWIKCPIGGSHGSMVLLDYVVGLDDAGNKGKGKASDDLYILLPTFSMPVNRLEVDLEGLADATVEDVHSNLTHHIALQTGNRLVHYNLSDFFRPEVRVRLRRYSAKRWIPSLSFISLLTLVLASWLLILRLQTDLDNMRISVYGHIGAGNTITTGTGHSGSSTERWWQHEPSPLTGSTSATKSPAYYAGTSPDMTHIPATATGTLDSSVTSLNPSSSSSSFQSALAVIPAKLFSVSWEDTRHLRIVVRKFAGKISHGMGKVWHLLRRVYHYPLTPP